MKSIDGLFVSLRDAVIDMSTDANTEMALMDFLDELSHEIQVVMTERAEMADQLATWERNYDYVIRAKEVQRQTFMDVIRELRRD